MTLPWVQPRSPGLFFAPLCRGVTLQSNELSRVVSAARLRLPAPATSKAPCGKGGGRCTGWKFLTADFAGARRCKFYKKNTLQTRSPTLVRTELLINNLETTGAGEPIPPSRSLPVLSQAVRVWGPPSSSISGSLVIPVPILLLLPSFHTGTLKSPGLSWR